MDDELELQQAIEHEADPEQAALMSLAVEVEAGNSSAEELADLAEEVDDKTLLEKFLEGFKSFFAGILSYFTNDPTPEESPETTPPDPNIRIVNTNPYIVLPEELSAYNANEQRSLRIIAQAGVSPRKIDQLYQSESPSSTSRESFFKYIATAVEACAHYQVSPDRMLPLCIATMCMESGYNERALNPRSNATGLMQHMPQYWDSRAHDLVLEGVFSTPPDIWDTRAQIFAGVNLYLNFMKSFTDDPSNYPPDKFARDAYFTYNSGGANGWLATIGALDWSNEQLTELYNMPVAERVSRYGEDADTFTRNAFERLTEPRNTRYFERVQTKYDEVRSAIYA